MDIMWENIKQIAEENHGYVKTGQIEAAGISRPMLKKYKDKGYLHSVRKGLYVLAGELPDEYMLLQVQKSNAIFSYGTALYLWELTDRVPHYIDVTLPRGTNCSRLKRDNPNVRFHYVSREIHQLGITEIRSPQGSLIKLYERERCICDIVRDKEKMDAQLFSQAIKDYFRTNSNPRKLLKYSKQFGIEEKIRTYMEVL